MEGLHFDKELWKNPEEFIPERFECFYLRKDWDSLDYDSYTILKDTIHIPHINYYCSTFRENHYWEYGICLK